MKRETHKLADLLVSLFSPDELRHFFRRNYPEVALAISWSGSLVEVAWSCVEALDRRGLIDRQLEANLIRARPNRAKEISGALGLQVAAPAEAPAVYLSFADEHAPTAHALSEQLQARGLRTLSQHDVPVGSPWLEAGSRLIYSASAFVFLVDRGGMEQRPHVRVEIQLANARSKLEGLPVIPIIVDGDSTQLPFGLMAFQALRLDEIGLEGVADQIARALGRARPVAQIVASETLTALAAAFFERAGRQVRPHADGELRVPEPVVVHDASPELLTLSPLYAFLGQHRSCFVVHRGPFPPRARRQLDELRLDGLAVVVIGDETVRAALTDDRCAQVLDQLSREQAGRENAFRPGNATLDRRFLFGRGAMLARVGSMLAQGEQILLSGTRKSGKTSFLRVLRQGFIDRPTVMIDLQGIDLRRADWPDVVFGGVIDAYDRWGEVQWHGDWPQLAKGAPVGELGAALSLRRGWHRERATSEIPRLLVLLDELERVFPREDQDPAAWVRFSGTLRALAQTERVLSLVAADLRPLANRTNLMGSMTNPFFAMFQELPMPLLAAEHVDDMVVTLAEQQGTARIEEGFSARLHALSGGHPWVARSIAAAATEVVVQPGMLHVQDLDAGLNLLYEEDTLGNFFRQNFWAMLDPAERSFLLAVASGKGPPRNSRVRAQLRSQGLFLDGKVPIGAFEEWLKDEALASAAK